MNEQIRVLIIGAHPDDCEFLAAGLAVKYRSHGHVVKFVSMTDGCSGHHLMEPLSLARRRQEEALHAAKIAGIECAVLGNYDGRLQADITTREELIGLIRAFGPDLIFTHRTNDYHPDHRQTAVLVQDCSYLIRVPHICPASPIVAKTPTILHLYDKFEKPSPFTADVIVAIDDVFDTKMQMLDCHRSQFYEWLPYIGGYSDEVPCSEAERFSWFHQRMQMHDIEVANRYRSVLERRYGQAGLTVRCAEAFEVSEYGSALPESEVDRWIPR